MKKVFIGYKKKWDMEIKGDKWRVNDKGYTQILDNDTKRWVTVDSVEEKTEELKC